MMMKMILHFLLTLVIYIICDLTWLTVFAKKFVHRQVGERMAATPDWVAAGVFYLIFTSTLLWFCVWPAAQASAGRVLLNGALFGLVTYGTYELVNKALLNRWPLPLVVVDMAWGIAVGALVSWVSWELGRRFGWI